MVVNPNLNRFEPQVARVWWTRRTLNDSELKREEKTGGARRAPEGLSPRTFH
jgi:hypothetical protein